MLSDVTGFSCERPLSSFCVFGLHKSFSDMTLVPRGMSTSVSVVFFFSDADISHNSTIVLFSNPIFCKKRTAFKVMTSLTFVIRCQRNILPE